MQTAGSAQGLSAGGSCSGCLHQAERCCQTISARAAVQPVLFSFDLGLFHRHLPIDGCCLQEQGTAKGQAAASASGARAQVEAASASEHLEALEQLLPESATALLQAVAMHAAGGPEHAFTCRQLLSIASTCLDLTDASSRNAAADLVQVQSSGICSDRGPAESSVYRANLRGSPNICDFDIWKHSSISSQNLPVKYCLSFSKHKGEVIICYCQGRLMCVQKLLEDRDRAPAQDPAMTSALVQLSSQVCSSMSELAITLTDAIGASLPNSADSGTPVSSRYLPTQNLFYFKSQRSGCFGHNISCTFKVSQVSCHLYIQGQPVSSFNV